LLVGDALGVPYEFHSPDRLPPLEKIEFTPPPGFSRAHYHVPPGTWSDDGAQALCLLDSLLACGRFDAEDFGKRLVRWEDEGYFAVDANVFDIGTTTSRGLDNLRRGVPAIDAGPTDEWSQGNGSLMRVLPLALWHRGPDVELVRDARLQSRTTHGHVACQVCAALYCLWARRVLEEGPDPWAEAVTALRSLLAGDGPAMRVLEEGIRPDEPPTGRGSGHVVDCLRSARLVLDAGRYEAVVKAAVALGHDTDTTACVAGGIAGLRDGVGAIPERWRTSLRGREMMEPLLRQLLSAGG
jgi:ADP-ribosyl-[dinitrogen reductase] hydrolase